MKTIGLLGGMSWQSTASYYRAINQGIEKALGGFHSAQIVLVSVDFHEIELLQRRDDWETAGSLLACAAAQAESAGADVLLICTNTMHKVASAIQESLTIPLLHIADATGLALQADEISTVGLIGTRFTMEQPFLKEKLAKEFGIQVLVPERQHRDEVHDIIFHELVKGKVLETSKQRLLRIIETLNEQGARAIILGCTELAMLIDDTDTDIPVFDTTQIHAQAALDFALDENVRHT